VTDRFQHHITEAKKDTAVFAFGRMNPPTTGHGVVVNKIIDYAKDTWYGLGLKNNRIDGI
jgi:nicotinamide mononucleotide adenylyltransferase